MAARIAIVAMTTSSSISVNPDVINVNAAGDGRPELLLEVNPWDNGRPADELRPVARFVES